ncbi:MAG TPA: PaaI family thioesterase [Longimicrobiales bacterium]|nr:PaaI family thioesterase [Longimicrobiales bacterium]
MTSPTPQDGDFAVTSPTPQDADFVARVRASFDRQALMALLGVRMLHVEAGVVVLGLDRDDRLTQQNGYLHAGVVTSVLDSACGYAAYTLMPAASDVLSVEFKVNLLRPAAGASFEARARVVKAGRTISTAVADFYSLDDGAGERHVAMMVATLMRVDRT